MKSSRTLFCRMLLAVCGSLLAYPTTYTLQGGASPHSPSAEILAKMFGVPGLPADPYELH